MRLTKHAKSVDSKYARIPANRQRTQGTSYEGARVCVLRVIHINYRKSLRNCRREPRSQLAPMSKVAELHILIVIKLILLIEQASEMTNAILFFSITSGIHKKLKQYET